MKTTHDGQNFVCVQQLRSWMLEPIPGQKLTNCDRLLYASSIIREQWSVIRRHAITIFSILLEIGHGDTVDHSVSACLNDKELPFPLETLRHRLFDPSVRDRASILRFISRFYDEQWAFTAAILGSQIHVHYGTKILPIETKSLIKKGGTATVYRVKTAADFVSGRLSNVTYENAANGIQKVCRSIYRLYPSLNSRISSTNARNEMWQDSSSCYTFVLKEYSQYNRVIFEQERDSFRYLDGLKGFIQCLGTFESTDRETRRRTYNILLELGDYDLADMFENYPMPIHLPKALGLWNSVSELVKSLKRLHDFTIEVDGKSTHVHGYAQYPMAILMLNLTLR